MAGLFRVARNPDDMSTLPYLIEVPLPSGPLLLKVKDTWPRTAKVYCHPADAWPLDAEVIEEVGVRSCVRRGVAIDLVLDRSRENRSQIVFTRLRGGREGIFWQSARTTRKTRPGLRIPTRQSASGALDIVSTRVSATRGSSPISKRRRRSGACRSGTTRSSSTAWSWVRSSARRCRTSPPGSSTAAC